MSVEEILSKYMRLSHLNWSCNRTKASIVFFADRAKNVWHVALVRIQ